MLTNEHNYINHLIFAFTMFFHIEKLIYYRHSHRHNQNERGTNPLMLKGRQ